MKKIHKYLTPIIYILLILACMGIVFLIGRLADPPLPELSSSESSAQETAAEETAAEETAAVATPSDAGEIEPGETGESSEPEVCPTEVMKDSWWKDYIYEPETEAEAIPEPYRPPVLMVASDLHYFSMELTDGGPAFEKMTADDDGKTVWYSDEMVDALLDEAVRQKPTALILAGDNTFYGEKINHLRLAAKLEQTRAQGVPVLIIPGNHDINSHKASIYFGDEKEATDTITASEFEEIYRAFGYQQALSRDEYSLSYVYELDESHWALMLDTNQYDPVNLVGGKVPLETLEWIREQLEYARENDIQVLPVGHHNLLNESRMYTFDCTIENSDAVTWLLQYFETPLYLSGHLHAQRVKRYQELPSTPREVLRINEIVLTPYSIPECRYGLLWWDDEFGMHFRTKAVSVSGWAKRQGIDDSNLLQFDDLAPGWSKNIIKEQVKKTLLNLPEEQTEAMGSLYAEIYYNYTKGIRMNRRQVEASEDWKLWERMDPDSAYHREIRKMLADCEKEHLSWDNDKK